MVRLVTVAVLGLTACGPELTPAESALVGNYEAQPTAVSGTVPQTATVRMEIHADRSFLLRITVRNTSESSCVRTMDMRMPWSADATQIQLGQRECSVTQMAAGCATDPSAGEWTCARVDLSARTAPYTLSGSTLTIDGLGAPVTRQP